MVRAYVHDTNRGSNARNAGLLNEAVVLLEAAVEHAEAGFLKFKNDKAHSSWNVDGEKKHLDEHACSLELADNADLADLFLFYEQLADVYGRVPDFEKAERVGNKSIALLKRLAKNQSNVEVQMVQLQLAKTLRNVGIACEMQLKLVHAELFFRQSLAILQGVHPKRRDVHLLLRDSESIVEKTSKKIQVEYDTDMSSCLHHLGAVIDRQVEIETLGPEADQSRRNESERYLRLAIAIREKMNTLDHLSCALPLHDLAVNLLAQGRVLEAEIAFRKSIAVRKDEKNKDNHATYMMTLHNLAELYAEQGLYTNAHSLFLKVTQLRKKRFGENSAIAANTMERHVKYLLLAPKELIINPKDGTYHDFALALQDQIKLMREKIAAEEKPKLENETK